MCGVASLSGGLLPQVTPKVAERLQRVFLSLRFIISWLAVEREALRAEAERLLGWLKLTVNHLEPLQHLLLSSGDQSSCDCHLIRLSLHIHWTAVSVSFRLAPVTGRSSVSGGTYVSVETSLRVEVVPGASQALSVLPPLIRCQPLSPLPWPARLCLPQRALVASETHSRPLS